MPLSVLPRRGAGDEQAELRAARGLGRREAVRTPAPARARPPHRAPIASARQAEVNVGELHRGHGGPPRPGCATRAGTRRRPAGWILPHSAHAHAAPHGRRARGADRDDVAAGSERVRRAGAASCARPRGRSAARACRSTPPRRSSTTIGPPTRGVTMTSSPARAQRRHGAIVVATADGGPRPLARRARHRGERGLALHGRT